MAPFHTDYELKGENGGGGFQDNVSGERANLSGKFYNLVVNAVIVHVGNSNNSHVHYIYKSCKNMLHSR